MLPCNVVSWLQLFNILLKSCLKKNYSYRWVSIIANISFKTSAANFILEVWQILTVRTKSHDLTITKSSVLVKLDFSHDKPSHGLLVIQIYRLKSFTIQRCDRCIFRTQSHICDGAVFFHFFFQNKFWIK